MVDTSGGQRPAWPEGFYTDWTVFSTEALSERMRSGDKSAVPTILLAAGASLGATALVALAKSNRKALTDLGEEWGIKSLPELVIGGGALLGAALGGFGGAMISRLLSSYSDEAAVEGLQAELAAAERAFTELNELRVAGRIASERHEAAVEMLFRQLASGG